jgi:hypothetical protein
MPANHRSMMVKGDMQGPQMVLERGLLIPRSQGLFLQLALSQGDDPAFAFGPGPHA